MSRGYYTGATTRVATTEDSLDSGFRGSIRVGCQEFSDGGNVFGHPGRAPPGHGVQLQQQLPHHRHQRRFPGLAPLTQALIKGLQLRVMPRRRLGRHVQYSPHWAAPASDAPMAAAGVIGQRSCCHWPRGPGRSGRSGRSGRCRRTGPVRAVPPPGWRQSRGRRRGCSGTVRPAVPVSGCRTAGPGTRRPIGRSPHPARRRGAGWKRRPQRTALGPGGCVLHSLRRQLFPASQQVLQLGPYRFVFRWLVVRLGTLGAVEGGAVAGQDLGIQAVGLGQQSTGLSSYQARGDGRAPGWDGLGRRAVRPQSRPGPRAVRSRRWVRTPPARRSGLPAIPATRRSPLGVGEAPRRAAATDTSRWALLTLMPTTLRRLRGSLQPPATGAIMGVATVLHTCDAGLVSQVSVRSWRLRCGLRGVLLRRGATGR